MITFRQCFSTIIKFTVLGLFWLINVTMHQLPEETTNVFMKTSQPTSGLPRAGSSPGITVAIVTSVIVAFIVIFIAALIVWKYKISNLPKDSSKTNPQSLSRGNISTKVYGMLEKEKVHDIKSNYEISNLEGREEKSIPTTDISVNVQQVGDFSKEIVKRGYLDAPDGTYETPDVKVYTYADPNEMKFCVTK